MKFGIKLLVLAIASVCITSMNLKNSAQSKFEFSSKEDFTQQWSQLFTSMERPPQLCLPPDHLNNEEGGPGGNGDDSGNSQTPNPKPNRFAKNQGQGPSAYLFDYWDEIFQKQIIQIFSGMFKKALAMKEPDANTYQDPYALDKLIYIYSNGVSGSPNATHSSPNSISQISQYNKNFNQEIWKNSVSAGQIFNILQQWGWQTVPSANPPKKIVDTYDFDGDGRLNPSEFILFSIINNYKIFRQSECKEECYSEILAQKIDPLFAYLDCDQDGFVSAENLWVGLRNLKRSSKGYNMYQCLMPTILNKDYRTTSTNDFVLKNYKKADGFVNIDEFRTGILLGYWDRQTDSTKVYTDDTKNSKVSRWGGDGSKDIVCDSILALIPKKNNKFMPSGNSGQNNTPRKMEQQKLPMLGGDPASLPPQPKIEVSREPEKPRMLGAGGGDPGKNSVLPTAPPHREPVNSYKKK